LEERNLLSTFMVDHLADDMAGSALNGSLRYCINHAADGDTISFGVTGTINLTGELPNLSHSISIQGPGPNQMTVQRGTSDYAVFTVPTGPTVSISGLTITNGDASGIVSGGTLTISNCTITGNTANYAGYGGGIYNAGTMMIINSTISGNSGVNGGGGIFNAEGGTLAVNTSTISGNFSNVGGGIYDNHASATVNNSTIVQNHARGGGAIYDGVDVMTVSNTTIVGNIADNGGGISCGGNLTVDNCTISQNLAGNGGGGGIVNYSLSLTISNSTIAGNSATGPGGGTYNHFWEHHGSEHHRGRKYSTRQPGCLRNPQLPRLQPDRQRQRRQWLRRD
jgi:hypothetical protein